MLFEYQGFSKKGGIYQIKNLLTNVVYIGSTREFKCRWYDHVCALKNGKHKTKHLRYSFNKHYAEQGNDDFLEFSILEVMENATKSERLEREEWWIQKFLNEGLELYNTNRTPTKEPSVHGEMSLEGKRRMIESKRGKRSSPATEYKAGHVPWTKENGHDEETRKLLGEKSKAMWETPEVAEKLLKSRRTKKFRNTQSKRMSQAWKESREQKLAAMNSPECKALRSEKAKEQWSDPEAKAKILAAMNNDESKKKRLISEVGEEKAKKILDPEWMKYNVESLGKKGTAKLLGVHVGTVRRWFARLFPYEISSKGIEFQQ